MPQPGQSIPNNRCEVQVSGIAVWKPGKKTAFSPSLLIKKESKRITAAIDRKIQCRVNSLRTNAGFNSGPSTEPISSWETAGPIVDGVGWIVGSVLMDRKNFEANSLACNSTSLPQDPWDRHLACHQAATIVTAEGRKPSGFPNNLDRTVCAVPLRSEYQLLRCY